MLKALKTLLKGDIIKENAWRIKLMGTQQQLTTEQVSILLWLKALNDFKGEEFENSSFNDKYDDLE